MRTTHRRTVLLSLRIRLSAPVRARPLRPPRVATCSPSVRRARPQLRPVRPLRAPLRPLPLCPTPPPFTPLPHHLPRAVSPLARAQARALPLPRHSAVHRALPLPPASASALDCRRWQPHLPLAPLLRQCPPSASTLRSAPATPQRHQPPPPRPLVHQRVASVASAPRPLPHFSEAPRRPSPPLVPLLLGPQPSVVPRPLVPRLLPRRPRSARSRPHPLLASHARPHPSLVPRSHPPLVQRSHPPLTSADRPLRFLAAVAVRLPPPHLRLVVPAMRPRPRAGLAASVRPPCLLRAASGAAPGQRPHPHVAPRPRQVRCPPPA